MTEFRGGVSRKTHSAAGRNASAHPPVRFQIEAVKAGTRERLVY